jgi:hypothetical protein
MTLSDYMSQAIPTKQEVGCVKLNHNEVMRKSITRDTSKNLEYHRISIYGLPFNYCAINGSGVLYRIGESDVPNIDQPSVFYLNKL